MLRKTVLAWNLQINQSGPKEQRFRLNLFIKQIADWTADIAAQNPDLVSRSVIGETYEGRPMYLLKVSALISSFPLFTVMYHSNIQDKLLETLQEIIQPCRVIK